MKDTKALRQAVAEYLRAQGLEAVTAWDETRRRPAGGAVSAVSLREIKSEAPGFQDYLGEQYDEAAGEWKELYGKRMELTFGLDLSAATAEEVQSGLDKLGLALSLGGPEGMKPTEFIAGETAYDKEAGRFLCPAQARFSVWATASAGAEDGVFLDFEVKGERGI